MSASSRLVMVIGAMLLVGFVASMLSPAPGISSGRTVPVRESELWILNPE